MSASPSIQLAGTVRNYRHRKANLHKSSRPTPDQSALLSLLLFSLSHLTAATYTLFSMSGAQQASERAWVDPALLPDDANTDISSITGSAPDYVKQLVCNTFYSYGVGTDPSTFGYAVGRATRFVDVSVERSMEKLGRLEGTTVAELTVTKGE